MSVDLFYDDGPPAAAERALAVEMEAATLFALGHRLGIPVGCVLVVSDTFAAGGERTRIEPTELIAAAELMGAAALAALAAPLSEQRR